MVDGALQHPLETQGGLGVAAIIVGQPRDRGLHGLFQIPAQAIQVGATGLEHGLGGGVFEQGEQQVFDRHEFMTCLAGALVALANRLFEVFAEHGGLRLRLETICGLTARFPSPYRMPVFRRR